MMKYISIGLTGPDLLSLKHQSIELYSINRCIVLPAIGQSADRSIKDLDQPIAIIEPNKIIHISALDNHLKLQGDNLNLKQSLTSIIVKPDSAPLFIRLARKDSPVRAYNGNLTIRADTNYIRLTLECLLEEYVLSVLHSEIPGSYHLEAIKAQAITARTYALNPRIDHRPDHCQVCDSYLCCQSFTGELATKNERLKLAIDQTLGQVIAYKDKPILALFSSCAGGHTENYESCFSDPITNIFPPQPIPYLRGVSESLINSETTALMNEQALQRLWHSNNQKTDDAWSPHFKWSLKLASEALDANMHHTVETMLAQKDIAPFVIPPKSGLFGIIESFAIDKRGVGGTGISMTIVTSHGSWCFQKELVIRSVFKNSEVRLSRLKSARIYFEHERDTHGGLKQLLIYGLGWGHGVGLQQTGAQGLASLQNKNYREILEHYFTRIELSKI